MVHTFVEIYKNLLTVSSFGLFFTVSSAFFTEQCTVFSPMSSKLLYNIFVKKIIHSVAENQRVDVHALRGHPSRGAEARPASPGG